MAENTNLSEQDNAICDAVINKGWNFAVLSSIKDNEEIRGMIIGDANYIEYVTKHLDEDYTVISKSQLSEK